MEDDKKAATDDKRTDAERALDPVPPLCGNIIGLWSGMVYGCRKPRGHEGPHVDGDMGWAQTPVKP